MGYIFRTEKREYLERTAVVVIEEDTTVVFNRLLDRHMDMHEMEGHGLTAGRVGLDIMFGIYNMGRMACSCTVQFYGLFLTAV